MRREKEGVNVESSIAFSSPTISCSHTSHRGGRACWNEKKRRGRPAQLPVVAPSPHTHTHTSTRISLGGECLGVTAFQTRIVSPCPRVRHPTTQQQQPSSSGNSYRQTDSWRQTDRQIDRQFVLHWVPAARSCRPQLGGDRCWCASGCAHCIVDLSCHIGPGVELVPPKELPLLAT